MKNENLALAFNPAPSKIMHIDINSCFATIEQQANPLIREKPVVVAAYNSPNGTVLASSVEAKRFGIKTGMRVKDAKLFYPKVVVLTPDPWKYRNVHLALRKLVSSYTDDFHPKSIDEFVLNLSDYLDVSGKNIVEIAEEMRVRIKKEIGEWMMVSIGIAPNRYLAKTAAGIKKPNGLNEINIKNYHEVYSRLKLDDLCGIKFANCVRLARMNIKTVPEFYAASILNLKAAFNSIVGYYWYLRLRGWEIDSVPFGRRSYGNSYSLPKPLTTPRELSPILCKLVEKMGARLRKAHYKASGIHLAVSFRNGKFWHKGLSTKETFDSRDFFKQALALLLECPIRNPVRLLAVSCFNLRKDDSLQLELFCDMEKKENTVKAADKVNTRWGEYIVTSARMAQTEKYVPDRIAFGNVKELEEFTSPSV